MFAADHALTDFYTAVFDTNVFTELGVPLPTHVEVDDIEATLARVWDLGGTIVSTDDVVGLGAVPRSAVFRDPRGGLVSIVAAAGSFTSSEPAPASNPDTARPILAPRATRFDSTDPRALHPAL